jgi:multidrug efflux pump subunit AcrA (membrane-fusion protein)
MHQRIAIWPTVLAAVVGIGIGVRIQYVHDQPYIHQAAAARAEAEKLQRESRAAIEESQARQTQADLAKQAAESAKAEAGKAAQAARAAELRAQLAALSSPGSAEPPALPGPTIPGLSPTAICVDGTYSYSLHRQGTCSHHGGVDVWYR